MINQRAFNLVEALLLKISSFAAICGVFLVIALVVNFAIWGLGASFAYIGAFLSVAVLAMMIYACFCVIRYRSVQSSPNLAPVSIFVLAPIIASMGEWKLFIPNLVVGVLLAAVAVMQRIVQPVRSKQRVMQGAPQAQPSEAAEPAYVFVATPSKISFANVTGMAEVKSRLLEAGREIAQDQSRRGESAPRNGILLFGEPGNGKTFFAEALAGELRLPLVSVTFGDVASKWVNQTTEQVMRAFHDARAQAPCVLFLDEIDSLIKDRNSSMSGGNDEAAKTTNALLTEIVKIRQTSVIVVAATNFLDKLDQAAIREGRFDFKVEITPPDEPARAALIQSVIAKHRGLVLTSEAKTMAAKRWQGFSVARIRTVAEEAARSVVKAFRAEVQYPDLQAALRTIQGRKGKLPEGTPTVDELVMMPSQKQRLQGMAIRMRDIEQIEEMGGTVPTGVLFWGPPGTGKTLTARALAKSTGWAFLVVAGNELLSRPDRIEELAREARDIRPCIIFIDEADDVLADRRYSPHGSSVTNRLLTAIDGAGGKVADVIWIAATNHPENMDAAALRGGRFTEKVEFALPDCAVIADFVQGWMIKSKGRFAEDATPGVVAALLDGLSIANIAAVLQQAVDLMVERRVTGNTQCVTTLEDVSRARLLVVDTV